MILLSIDVGIRNLAYIVIQLHDVDHHEILKWDVIELIEPHEKAGKVKSHENNVIYFVFERLGHQKSIYLPIKNHPKSCLQPKHTF